MVIPNKCVKRSSPKVSLQCIDLEINPPPDSAIEADVTSKTTLEAYQAIKVPELWIFADRKLKIYVLGKDGYLESSISPTFPDLDIVQIIPELVEQAFTQETRRMLKSLREQL